MYPHRTALLAGEVPCYLPQERDADLTRRRPDHRVPVPVRVALVGVGPHAEVTWLPAIVWLAQAGQLALDVAVDVEEDRPRRRLSASGLTAEFLKVTPLRADGDLSSETIALLDRHTRSVDLVIVATEPKAHIGYALWAAQRRKHVIIDKPLSIRQGSIHNRHAALQTLADWERLNRVHCTHRDRLMIVNAHRRFEPAYLFALNLLREVAAKTGVGLTFSSIRHSDGQWRTREDISRISYHGFLDGTGKIGHSGYHFLDYWACAVTAGTPQRLLPENVQVTASLHQPATYVRQVDESVNHRFLNGHEVYSGDFDFDDTRLGEVDAFTEISLRRDGRPVSHFQLALLHSGLRTPVVIAASLA